MANIDIGDLVTRKSHDSDLVFKVTKIFEDDIGQLQCMLKGMYLRLMVDAPMVDLELVGEEKLCKNIIDHEILHKDSLAKIMLRRGMEREKAAMI